MIKTLRSVFLTGVTTLLIMIGGGLGQAPVYAVAANPTGSGQTSGSASGNTACGGLDLLGGSQSCGSGSQSTVDNIVNKIVVFISLVAGALGVIMIIVAGLRFITAAGDPGNVAKARTALLYAGVGLLVAALAQLMVHFVLGQFSG